MKVKNRFEKQSLNNLLEALDSSQKDLSTQITLLQTKRNIYVDEFNKFENRGVPNIKNLDKVIKELEPLYKEYHRLGMELFEIKQELVRRTGLKEAELQALYNLWKMSKVLNNCGDGIAI